MKLILIGTDHRLQYTVTQNLDTKAWVPRDGQRFRRLIAYCIKKLGPRAILEEAHPKQEQLAPTICCTIAKEHSIAWKALALGEPDLSDVLLDPSLSEAMRLGIKPDLLAGRYNLETHKMREAFMFATIMQALQEHGCVLAVVGYMHLSVLARRFEDSRVSSVEALVFTYPLVVDESKA
jgi:hypothetical protein